MVDNFRRVNGLGSVKLYRCASLDGLVRCLEEEQQACENVGILLHEAGFILDLRSPKERQEQDARVWMSRAPGGPFAVYQSFPELVKEFDAMRQSPALTPPRVALWLNVLSRERLRYYIRQNWMPPSSPPKMLPRLLFEHGLLGLNQAILEAGKEKICHALQAITLYWEQFPHGVVVVHCVQGKDRTGMLIMLIQSITGASDEDIIAEYHRSDPSRRTPFETPQSRRFNESTSTAIPPVADASRMITSFARAPAQVMQATLEWIRVKYGSIHAYLDGINFDSLWRQRMIHAMNKFNSEALTASTAISVRPQHGLSANCSKM
jgi:hypothetical protein